MEAKAISLGELATANDPTMDFSGGYFFRIADESGKYSELPMDSREVVIPVLKAQLCLQAGFRNPSDKDVRNLIDVMKGIAIRKPRRTAVDGTKLQFEANPLARTLVAFSRQRGGGEYQVRNLLTALTSLAKSIGIYGESANWPTSEDALGCQLRRITQLVRTKGVILERVRKEERCWSIRLVTASDRAQKVQGDESVEGVVQVSDASDDVEIPYDSIDTLSPSEAEASDEEILNILGA